MKIGLIHPMTFCKWFFAENKLVANSIIDINVIGMNWIKIETKKPSSANLIIGLNFLKEHLKELVAYNPEHLIRAFGVTQHGDPTL